MLQVGRTFRTLSLALLATGVFADASAQKISLRFVPPVGKTFNYVASNDVKGAAGGPQIGNMGQTMEMAVSILSKSAKGTKVRTKITGVKVKAPAGSPMANRSKAMQDQLKGLTSELVYDARARMVGTASASDPRMAQVMGRMGSMGAGFLGVEFPAGPVGPGSKWNSSIDIGKLMGAAMPGMMKPTRGGKVNIVYTLQKLEKKGGKNLARVAMTMNGSVDLDINMGAQGSQPMKMSMSLSMKGTILVDTKTGMPTSGESKGTIGVKMPQGSMDQNLTSTFKMK
jgi:hypothetical protein